MVCPTCGGRAKVAWSRATARGIRRRYNCPECGDVFYTFERVEEPEPVRDEDCLLRRAMKPGTVCGADECLQCGWNAEVARERIRRLRGR